MAVDDVARRAGHKHSLSLRKAVIRIETLEKRYEALYAAHRAGTGAGPPEHA